MPAFIVRQSSIKSWRNCRKEYNYKQIQRIEPRKPKKPLIRGTIIHEMCEAHINSGSEKPAWKVLQEYEKVYGKLFREEQEMYGDIIEDISRIMEGYFWWWAKDPLQYLAHPKTKSKAEHDFEMELDKGIIQRGTIDSVAKTKDGRVWLVEHKSVNQLPPDMYGRYSDVQSVTYTKAVPGLGFPKVDGVCWNYIRAKPPAVPEKLKSGELTRRNIDTIWPVYEREIKRHKLDPADYDDMKKQLAGKESDFYMRVYLPVKPAIIQNVLNDTIMTAHEMAELHNEPTSHVRNITRNCHFCSYNELCKAELRGDDTSFMLKKDFKPIKENEDEIEKKARHFVQD